MNIWFEGDVKGLEAGIGILACELGFEVAEGGITVKAVKSGSGIKVSMKDGRGIIEYTEKSHFFRALGLLAEALRDKACFEIVEEPQFKTIGAMLDVSRNAVLKVESIKKFIRKMALMGMNAMMLYTEDTYNVEGRPYFGYMRGRYSRQELKECDDYANTLGIEVIPCIQSLAHLTQALKWSYADSIKDTDDILLAGNADTYRFIEEMISSISSCFRSKKIHIGMDEADNLGLGKYLAQNGYRRRFDIMSEHLVKVLEITKKYGLEPMIWSDMYFRLGSKTGWYYDLDTVIPDDVIASTPKEVKLVYWDYYHEDEEFYIDFIKRHKKFGRNPVFAGGVCTWNGISVNYGATFLTSNAALRACKREGLEDVFVTMWGDDGAETNLFTTMLGLQLYAEHAYSRELDEEKLRRRFEFCNRADFDAFMDLRYLDEIPGVPEGNLETANPSKFLLWQDVLIGLFDRHVEGIDVAGHYTDLKEKIKKHLERNKEWKEVLEMPLKLCNVLEIKGDIGIRIKKCYDAKDNEELEKIVQSELPELYGRIGELRQAHMNQWFATCKPFGWEVLDIRYGGLLARVDTAMKRLEAYLDGTVDKIEELEEERLYFDGPERPAGITLGRCNQYSRIASANAM